MNVNQALQAILHFQAPDCLCQFEWGYWPETLARWKLEGMRSEDPWNELDITYYHRVPVHTRLFPPFEEKVLAETASTRTIQDGGGIIKEIFKDATALPRHIRHPVKCLEDFEQLKERLDPFDRRRFSDHWDEEVGRLAHRNSILVMGGTEISFFGWHRDLMGVDNLLLAYYDQPALIHAISQHHLFFLQELYARILQEVVFDFIFVWEDMSYKNGPLISPSFVKEFMIPYYREITGFFREFGDYKFLLDSDGDMRTLIPLFIDAGIDGLLPFEVAAGMDICQVAEQYPDLIIAGGIDKREIAKGKKAIDQELQKKLPYMFRRGGYLPSLDHHVPPEISYEDFKYYLHRVRELFEEYGKP